MDLIGLAEAFSASVAYGNGYAIESEFWQGPDDVQYLIHQAGGPWGNDIAKTPFNEGAGTLSQVCNLRDPPASQSTPFRWPYIFKGADTYDYMVGAKSNGSGAARLLYFGGPASPKWYDVQPQPILSDTAGSNYAWLTNVAVLPLPGGTWMAAIEIAGGLAFALTNPSVSPISFDGSRTPGYVIPGGGNPSLRLSIDGKTVIMWLGMRSDPLRFNGAWHTTIATAKVADLLAAGGIADASVWTIHRDRFAIGKLTVDVCDPAPLDGPNGARLMVSYAQNSLRLLSSKRSMQDIYRDLLA